MKTSVKIFFVFVALLVTFTRWPLPSDIVYSAGESGMPAVHQQVDESESGGDELIEHEVNPEENADDGNGRAVGDDEEGEDSEDEDEEEDMGC